MSQRIPHPAQFAEEDLDSQPFPRSAPRKQPPVLDVVEAVGYSALCQRGDRSRKGVAQDGRDRFTDLDGIRCEPQG